MVAMLNRSYSIQEFHKKVSEAKTLGQLSNLLQDPRLDLSIHITSSLPWGLCWDVYGGSLTGDCRMDILPKLLINGEPWEVSNQESLIFSNFYRWDDLGNQFLLSIKRSLKGVQKVWN